MTRRPYIALIVLGLVALVAALMPASARRHLWLTCAYIEEPVTQSYLMREGSVVFRKRFEWLPLERYVVDDQLCRGCELGNHGNCVEQYLSMSDPGGFRDFVLVDGTTVTFPGRFRCICSKQEHALCSMCLTGRHSRCHAFLMRRVVNGKLRPGPTCGCPHEEHDPYPWKAEATGTVAFVDHRRYRLCGPCYSRNHEYCKLRVVVIADKPVAQRGSFRCSCVDSAHD